MNSPLEREQGEGTKFGIGGILMGINIDGRDFEGIKHVLAMDWLEFGLFPSFIGMRGMRGGWRRKAGRGFSRSSAGKVSMGRLGWMVFLP